MSLNLETQEVFRNLGLADVPGDWVSVVWEQNFCETVTLPIQVEETVLSESGWRRAVAACRRWVGVGATQQGEEDDDEEEDAPSAGFWTTLLDGELSHRSLLALLYCLLERSKQRVADKLCAIHAAQLYFVLLQIPGSGAFKIFHPMIFQKALDVFYLLPDRVIIHRRRSSTRSTSGEGVRGGRRDGVGGGRGRRGKRKRQEPEDDSALDESVQEEAVHGGEEEVKRLLKNLIKDLLCLLRALALADQEMVRCQVVQAMVRMTRSQLTSAPGALMLGRAAAADAPLCVYAWQCLESLCQPLHGGLEGTITEVFRQLLPSLLMLTADGGVHTASSIPHFFTISSQHAVNFVCHIWEQHGEVVVTPLRALVQHLCIKIPDRAEYRNKLAAVVRKLLSLLSDQAYSQLLDWIYKYSRNTKVGYRVFALDIVSELLSEALRQPAAGALSGEEEYRLSYKFLLKMVLSRCSDKVPTVRGRALTCLATAASSVRSEVRAAVKRSIGALTAVDPLLQTPSAAPPESMIMSMVHRRATDEKVGVRKAALQALEAIVRMDLDNMKKEDVSVIHERCLDPALSVRKQALSSLNALTLERMQCSMLHSLWLDGVLPMVMDRESGAQEKCMSLLEEVLLNNIVPLDRSKSEPHVFVWQLLALIASEERLDLRRYLWRALEFWAKKGKLTPSLVKAVCSHTASKEHLQAAWMLLAELSLFTTAIDSKFLMDSWSRYSSSVSMTTSSSPLVQILVVIGNLARNLSKVAIQDIKDQIVPLLSTFKLSPDIIQAAVNTLCQICSAVSPPPKAYQASLDSWCLPLLRSAEEYLSAVLLKSSASDTSAQFNETEAICYLFTLGEITQLCPTHTSHHLCRMVQSMLLATSEQEEDSQRSSSQDSRLTGLSELSLTPTLRAHTYITLGKLCLQHEDLAKTSILQMVRELETSQHAAVRNNIIVVLCDLAVRYSTKVDPYISNISACVRDPSLLVRRQALTLLARLLQEDYIKWRGSLFFRFVSTLVDDEMRRFSEFCLVHLLLCRQPAVFFQHFVECVFHFNSYQKHRVYNKFRQSEREKQLFSLRGSNNASKRLAIYTFLLSHMADEHRFQLTAKLCQEVLGGVVDGALPLEEDTSAVVRDTLAVLTSKEIKLSSLRRNVGEELADEGDHVGAAVATAQTKIISQIVKRNVIENIVPIVISAKHLFEREHSPLLKDLLLYLKELMQDYRSEVAEILAADPQLAEEIQFDLKRFAEEQKRLARGQQTPLTTTPHAQMISPLLSPGVLGSPAAGGSVFTPPRLRREGGVATTPARNIPIAAKATPVLKTKTPLPLGISPLLVVRKVQPPRKAPPLAAPTSSQPTEGLSSPEAAKTRASMINSQYAASIMTPVIPLKTPRIPLQKAVLLSTARRAGLPQKPHLPPPRTPARVPPSTDETVLHIPGRAASTPEGLAESISFNVSSLVPPSPIPANTTVDCYSTRSRTRSQARKKKKEVERQLEGEGEGDGEGEGREEQGADIMMISPNAQPRRLAKWKVSVK